MLKLDAVDTDEIARALADLTNEEHRWLIDAGTYGWFLDQRDRDRRGTPDRPLVDTRSS